MTRPFAYVTPAELRARHDAPSPHQKPALAQEHSATSVEAAQRIEPQRGRLQTLVYQAIQASGPSGRTAQELEDDTGLPGNTVRPRLTELYEAQRIRRSGLRRRTRSGRNAEVWTVA